MRRAGVQHPGVMGIVFIVAMAAGITYYTADILCNRPNQVNGPFSIPNPGMFKSIGKVFYI